MHRDAADLVEVPFANGLLPWGKTVEGSTQGAVFAVRTHNSIQVYTNTDDIVLRQEVELPALSSVAAVEPLNTPPPYCYFEGYHPAHPGDRAPPTRQAGHRGPDHPGAGRTSGVPGLGLQGI